MKLVNPYHIRPVARGAGKKKGQPRTIGLLILVDTTGFEPAYNNNQSITSGHPDTWKMRAR